MTWVRRLRSSLDRHVVVVRGIVDGLVVVVVGALSLLLPHPDAAPGQVVPLPALVAVGVSCLALAGIRRWPRASLALIVLATGSAVALAGNAQVWTIANVVGMYTTALRTDRRTTIRGFVASAVVFVGAVSLVRGD